jgi:hypothetical protein
MQNRPNRTDTEPIPTWDNWSYWGGLCPPRPPLHFLVGRAVAFQTHPPAHYEQASPLKHPIEYQEYRNTEPLLEANLQTESNLALRTFTKHTKHTKTQKTSDPGARPQTGFLCKAIEESWKRNDEESWRRNHWKRNHREGIHRRFSP